MMAHAYDEKKSDYNQFNYIYVGFILFKLN